MEYLINLALGILGSIIAAEIVFHHKRWCRRIIQTAAGRIKDPAQSEIKLEEWLAALDEHVGVIASFSHATGCWIGAPAVAAALKAPVAKKASRHGGAGGRRKNPALDVRRKVYIAFTRDLLKLLLKHLVRDALAFLRALANADIGDTIESLMRRSRWFRFGSFVTGLTGLVASSLAALFKLF